MARKSKSFRELIAQENLTKKNEDSFEEVNNTVIKNRLNAQGVKFVENPEGYEKMSEILIEFVKPYLDNAKTYQRRQALFGLAVASWNMAILPEKERQKTLKNMLKKLDKHKDPELANDTQILIEQFIERKLTLFADCNRLITDFELHERPGFVDISVASVPSKKK